MGLFSKMTEKVTKEWAQNLTPEQIEEYERQGMDMSEYRIINEEYRAEQQRIIDAVDLSMLERYKNPCNVVGDFVDDVAKFNGVSDKKKGSLEQMPLIYGKVVQAYYGLYKPCTGKDKGGGGMVVVFALDDEHRYNEEWLTKTAERISEMKELLNNQPDSMFEKICGFLKLKDNIIYSLTLEIMFDKKKQKVLPEDCRNFIGVLSNDKSSFCFPLGKSLSGDADAWCATFSLDDQTKLPFSIIPHNKIIPLLLSEPPKQRILFGLEDTAKLVPPNYYTK